MAFQPAEHCAMIELKWSGPGDLKWQNNLHFLKSGFDENDMDDLNAIMDIAWNAADLKALVSTDVLLGESVCTDLRTQGATQKTLIIGDAGTSAVDMAAQGAALVSTFRTDLRGRSYRGRFYMAGISDTFIENGEFTLPTAQDLVAFLEEIQSGAAAFGWTLVVLSRWLNDVERIVALGEEVTSILVRALRPGSQRRRNRRP